MTRAEFFDKVARLVNATWPHSTLPNAALASMFDELADLPADHAVVAIRVLNREGREFAPSGGQIRAKVVDLATDAPEWGKVRRQILRLHAYSPQRWRDGGIVDERQEHVELAHPLVARFIDMVGWDEIEQLLDAANRTAEAQLRDKWKAMVAGDKGDITLMGLPTLPGLKRLERVNGDPHQLRAAELLGITTPAEVIRLEQAREAAS